MDAEFFIRDREYRINQMAAERVQLILGIATDLIGLERLRIQRSGLNSDGVPFTPYSKQYAKRREVKGLQSDKVDFTVTGRMLGSIRPFVLRQLEGTTEVVIKASNQTEQDKLNWQKTKPTSRPRGNILIPTQKEIGFLKTTYFNAIQKYL